MSLAEGPLILFIINIIICMCYYPKLWTGMPTPEVVNKAAETVQKTLLLQGFFLSITFKVTDTDLI
jgi:hypothetical protein